MFNFLNSTVLFAAAAALIPLIIHLFSKRKVKVIEFSSLKHLKAMQRRQVRRLKIRQLLLLIIRMLIILLVVLAFARPTTRSGAVGSHASVSAVVLLDNSASMNRYVVDGNLFDIAKNRARKLLETFGESDEVHLVALAGTDTGLEATDFTSPVIAIEQLDQISPAFDDAAMTEGLKQAAELLGSAVNVNKELYIVTDRQRSSLPDSAVLTDLPASVYFVDLPIEPNDNLGITQLDFGGQLILPGHDFTVTAKVKNYSENAQQDIIASLFIDGNRVAQSDFDAPAGDETPVRFTRSVSTTGFHSGYVELSDDKYQGDNRYYFSFRIPERSNLLIIDGDHTGGLLSLALAPSNDINQYWSVKVAEPQNLSGVNFWEYDVIFLAGAPPLPETYAQRIKAFVGQGRSLLITYGPESDTGLFNSTWSGLTGVVYDQPVPRTFTRAGYYSLGSFEMAHPIFSVFNFTDNRPPEIKFYTLPRMRTVPGARTLMRFTGDRPALVESRYITGRVLTFTAPLDARFSDLTGHAFFVPFISRIAEYLAADLSAYDLRLYCGTNLTRTISVKGALATSMQLIAPDSSQYAIAPQEQDGSLVLRITQAGIPGIYHIVYAGREIDRLAVNIDPQESDLTSVDTDQFAMAAGAPGMKVLPDDAEMAAVISEFRFGRELWPIFVWLALLFIAAEILLSRGTRVEEQP
ncbi:MAG: BatA domain-containing protein [Candidatus Zixiibacteriota bacterium]